MLTWPAALALEGCAYALVAWSVPRGRSGAMAATAFSIAAFLLPIFVVAEPRLARAVVAFVGVLCVMRLVDLLRGARPGSLARRLWFVVTPFDVRQASFSSSALDRRQTMVMVGFALLTTLSVLTLRRLPASASAPLLLARWLVGALFCYAAADTLVAAIRVGYRLAGVVTPEIHRAPVLSRSIGEFWGERWNRPMHEWLSRHCFTPVARRCSPTLGVAVAFVASTIVHGWMTFFGAGIRMAAVMAAFFLLQGVLVLVERALGVARWSSVAAHSWTVVCVLGASPLFVEPILRIVGL